MQQNIIKHFVQTHSAGVYPYQEEKITYWIKIGGEDKATFVRWLSAKLSRLTQFSFLQSRAAEDSHSRFQHEKKVIHTLCDHNLPAPTIVLEDDNYFVTENEGIPLDERHGLEVSTILLAKVFDAFTQLHEQDIAHGRPALRDILIKEHSEVTLIDFEEAQLNANAQLKARDIFLLLMDLSKLEDLPRAHVLNALQHWRKKEDPKVWQSLLTLTSWLNRLRWVANTVLFFKPRNGTSQRILKTLDLIERV